MTSLLFAGDIIPPIEIENIYSEELLQLLAKKDFSMVNLESPLTTHNLPINKTGVSIKSHPEAVKHIKEGMFDAVCLSNNHIRDFGHQGVVDTIDICCQNGIQTVGAGTNVKEAQKPLHITLKGKKVCILNYSEKEFNIATDNSAGANPYSPITAYYDIEREKKQNDFVIVVYHGGLEYHHYPTPEIVQKFKYMVDLGAHAVISHHTHRYSGYMEYRGRPLLFGLGNFYAQTITNPHTGWLNGAIAKIKLGNGKVNFELIPISMDNDFRGVDITKDSQVILKHIDQISREIAKPNFLDQYWGIQYAKESKRIIALLKAKNRYHYQLLKRLPNLKGLSAYKQRVLLNMLRCDSHRERLIAILENF